MHMRLHSLLLSLSLALVSCLPEPSYFFDSTQAVPTVTVYNTSDSLISVQEDGTLSQAGRAPGARIFLEGQGLEAPETTVRFGEAVAELASVVEISGGTRLSVLVPEGPPAGGQVDVTVSNAGGVTRVGAFEYRVDDTDLLKLEVASLAMTGGEGEAPKGRVGLWNHLSPGAVYTLLDEGSLYYSPANRAAEQAVGEPVFWPVSTRVPLNENQAVFAVERVLVTQEHDGAIPYAFTWDRLQAHFRFCSEESSNAPAWEPGARYAITLSGGVLSTPLQYSVQAPEGFEETGNELFPLNIDPSTGVGVININFGLELTLGSTVAPSGARSSVLVELVAFVPGAGFDEQPFVRQRLVLDADSTLESFSLPVEWLQEFPEIHTTCARLGAELVRVRGLNQDESEVLNQYLDAGCVEPDNPLETYRLQAALRVTRHALWALPLRTGLAGCSTPGSCDAEGSLVVDLATQLEVPVDLLAQAVSDCSDRQDNDQDGLIDELDPGCENSDDTDEMSELLVCDDGKDNDGDGKVDARFNIDGDPGCDSPNDDDERGVGICDDNKDNDGDGRIDFVLAAGVGDAGCVSVADTSENERSLVCDDGVDNDADNRVDYKVTPGVGDPGCLTPEDPTDYDETGTWACDDRVDNDGDGTVDTEDPGCRPGGTAQHSPYEPDELNPLVECDDGIDNDRDGTIDYRVDELDKGDPECKSVNDTDERR
ncbi:MAG: hypothetical protein ACKO6N_06830 [Myxococcota bacterium]